MRKYSLRRELIYDLSLLAFCAAILSSGVLLVSLRMRLVPEIEPYVRHLVKDVHEKLSGSDLFRDYIESTKLSQPISLTERFADEMKSLNLPDEEILLSVRSENLPETFEEVRKPYLFLLSTVRGYRWQVPISKTMTLEYEWRDRRIEQALHQSKYLVLVFALIVSIVSVLIGHHLLLKRHILIPLKGLSQTAASFLREDWSARVDILRRDELGEIGEALNEMARKIEEKEKKLVLTIQSLQKANEEIEVSKNEQLQIEKLASVGRLAAGVAHEVGNPLGAISGYVDILRRAIQNPSKLSSEDVELCDRIEAETNRISRIIRALLHQARPSQDRIRSTKIEPILKRSVELAQIPESVEVVFEIPDLNAEVMCERDQLIQVCLNMLINAKHAIESKGANVSGKIIVRLAQRKLAPYEMRDGDEDSLVDVSTVRALKPQLYWVVSFVDNGVGISDSDKGKLFEPFFTTKDTGKGTGLGLYVAKSIIESFRGTIVVQSALGYGSSFSIFLPREAG